MGSDSVIRRLAVEQRKRLLASVLNAVEQEADPRLRRERVVAAINTYHDFMLDVIKVSDDGVIRNEDAIALIAQVHASQARMESLARAGRSA